MLDVSAFFPSPFFPVLFQNGIITHHCHSTNNIIIDGNPVRMEIISD
jgi:hypothetical protein